MKRVFVAGMHHESNPLSPLLIKSDEFKVLSGDELFGRYGSNDSLDALNGVIQTLTRAGCEVVPGVFCTAVPNGRVDYGFYLRIKKEIIEAAEREYAKEPFDAMTLVLHGSMYIDKLGDAEGHLLEELKMHFPEIPIFASLDMHGTMTDRMHFNCDGFVAYKTAPHTDCFETGAKAAKMTLHVLETGIKPHSAWVRLPVLIAGEQSATTAQPMASLVRELEKTQEKPGIMAASYLMGFPWADSFDSSAAVYVVAKDKQVADLEAVRLARLFWEKKDEFRFETEALGETEATHAALESVQKGIFPVYLSDSGDNPTAGSSSDVTEFVQRLIKDPRLARLNRPVLYGGFYDPVACRECEGRTGEKITLTFGAKFDTKTSLPVTATGVVKNFVGDMGTFAGKKVKAAVFSVGNIDIIISDSHIGYDSPLPFLTLGMDIAKASLVVCKLGYLGPAHEVFAKRAILVLTKGSTNEDLKSIHYHKVQRPIFPLDDGFSFDPQAYLK